MISRYLIIFKKELFYEIFNISEIYCDKAVIHNKEKDFISRYGSLLINLDAHTYELQFPRGCDRILTDFQGGHKDGRQVEQYTG